MKANLMNAETFQEFPKIARFSRDCIVTEKIDGTNAQVLIEEVIPPAFPPEDHDRIEIGWCYVPVDGGSRQFRLRAGSRSRWITPQEDNHGFAKWTYENAVELVKLGPGRHFGEWWGSGIQRGYGLTKGEKRFSLFNVSRWCLAGETPQRIQTLDPRIEKYQEVLPSCCHLVPVLSTGPFDAVSAMVEGCMASLGENGSAAAPHFMNPEGIVVFHVAGNVGFKKTFVKDDMPKSLVR